MIASSEIFRQMPEEFDRREKNFAREFFRKKRTLGFNYKAFALCLRNKFDAITRGPTISGRSKLANLIRNRIEEMRLSGTKNFFRINAFE
jgi:hypothetical protein